MRQTLLAGLPAYSVTLSDGQIDTLCRFGEALIEKNAVMNLTAITKPSAVAQLHFLDCIALLNAVDFREKRVIDVGCGAGFPGVPLKIAEPSIRLTLLDSLAKRMNWLSETLPALGVDAEIITARAEEFAAQRREQYDLATSRAVARLNVLAELCLPYVRVGGKFLAMKGALAQEEVEEARRGIEKLGGHVLRIFEYPVADAVHKAVVIEKLRPTPPQYPRAFAKIKNRRCKGGFAMNAEKRWKISAGTALTQNILRRRHRLRTISPRSCTEKRSASAAASRSTQWAFTTVSARTIRSSGTGSSPRTRPAQPPHMRRSI